VERPDRRRAPQEAEARRADPGVTSNASKKTRNGRLDLSPSIWWGEVHEAHPPPHALRCCRGVSTPDSHAGSCSATRWRPARPRRRCRS